MGVGRYPRPMSMREPEALALEEWEWSALPEYVSLGGVMTSWGSPGNH